MLIVIFRSKKSGIFLLSYHLYNFFTPPDTHAVVLHEKEKKAFHFVIIIKCKNKKKKQELLCTAKKKWRY